MNGEDLFTCSLTLRYKTAWTTLRRLTRRAFADHFKPLKIIFTYLLKSPWLLHFQRDTKSFHFTPFSPNSSKRVVNRLFKLNSCNINISYSCALCYLIWYLGSIHPDINIVKILSLSVVFALIRIIIIHSTSNNATLSSLCSASYVSWQRGTARICCCGADAADRRPCSDRSISPACRAHSSKPAAAASGGWMLGQTDRRLTVT